MRWSIPVGRVCGITLRLHVTFLLFLALIGYVGFAEQGGSGALWALALVLALFACVVLHELGHSLVAQRLGVEVKSITLLPIGGVAGLRRIPENPWQEMAITIAGPLVNVAIAGTLLPWTGLPHHLLGIALPHNLHGLLVALVEANITLAVFNFIPAFPMDGGRMLRAVLALLCSYRRATVIAATVGQGLAIVFMLAGLRWSVWWILIGVFIFIGAEGEEKMVRVRSLLRDLDVEEVMSREFTVLAPSDNLAHALERVYQTGQDDFPVLDGDQLVGMLSRPDIVEVMNERGTALTVSEAMTVEIFVVQPHTKLLDVYEDMLTEHPGSFPVMENGRLIGLLGPDNISRYVLVQSSLKSNRRGAIQRHVPAQTPAPPPVIATGHRVAPPPPPAESAPPTAPA